MSKPTLSPASETSIIVLPATGDTDNVATALPFGIYASAEDFISGASDQVAYVYQKLGGETLNLELTENQVYSAYEESVLEYSYIVNVHQAKNILPSVLGNTTGSFDNDGKLKDGDALEGKDIALKYPKWEFSYGRRVGSSLGSGTGVAGDKTIYSASFNTIKNKQDYDLQEIVSSSAVDGVFGEDNPIGGKRIYITKVFYKTPHSMWRFYGYYGGLNTVGDLASYGQFADDSTFEIIPAWQNKMQAMAFEDAIFTRNSHYSYEIKNNNLRIYPSPVRESTPKFWINFYVLTNAWEEDSDAGADGVNNMNTLPFENIPYQSINSIGKQWIRRFALSVCKEMLGLARNKFSSIPIPGDSVSLNGDSLISQGQQEQQALREELKTVLDELTYQKLTETAAAVVDATGKVLEKVPLPVVMG